MSKQLERKREELAAHYSVARSIPRELPSELRALAAMIVNMLGRHTHEQRQAILRFALEREKFIPVNRSSVFAGTSIMRERSELVEEPGEAPAIE